MKKTGQQGWEKLWSKVSQWKAQAVSPKKLRVKQGKVH